MPNYNRKRELEVNCWHCGKDYNTTEHESCPKCGYDQKDERIFDNELSNNGDDDENDHTEDQFSTY